MGRQTVFPRREGVGDRGARRHTTATTDVWGRTRGGARSRTRARDASDASRARDATEDGRNPDGKPAHFARERSPARKQPKHRSLGARLDARDERQRVGVSRDDGEVFALSERRTRRGERSARWGGCRATGTGRRETRHRPDRTVSREGFLGCRTARCRVRPGSLRGRDRLCPCRTRRECKGRQPCRGE